MFRSISAVGLLLVLTSALRAEANQAIAGEQPPVAIATRLPAVADEQPFPPDAELVEDPTCGAAPSCPGGWRFEMLSAGSLLDDESDFEARLNLGYEYPDGSGWRGQFWMFEEDTSIGGQWVEFVTSTLYLDHYQRHYFREAEFTLGGGFAASYLDLTFPFFNDSSRFYGAGASIVGDGFVPVFRFKRTDIGLLGRARIALVAGDWNEGDVTLGDFSEAWAMLIEEFAWGAELRHRFGDQQWYWYINIMREMHHWGDVSLPYDTDLLFDGTMMSLGWVW